MGAAAPGVEVRPLPGGPADTGLDRDLRHALRTDPDGAFQALGPEGRPVGRAAGVVRGETLQLVRLEVDAAGRGRGAGSALLEAVKTYGRGRGARALETVSPDEATALGFLLRRGLPARALALELSARAGEVSPGPVEARAGDWALEPLGTEGLSGWVADLDRETRGFARTPDWIEWLGREGVDGWAVKRRGRPDGVAVLSREKNAARIGPVEARLPAAVAAVIPALARRAVAAGATRVSILVPAEARVVLQSALSCGFRVASSRIWLATRARGDVRRYAASGSAFY